MEEFKNLETDKNGEFEIDLIDLLNVLINKIWIIITNKTITTEK